MTHLPLSGIKVLDLSRVLAAPWATQYLADLGAEVIKIERPNKGDDARHYGPPYVKDSQGHPTSENSFFLSCNRGKKSVTVNISMPEGQDIIRKLSAESDIFVENFKVGNLARYGLDYDHLRKINPRLIYCSITGFGQTGPMRELPGYDSIFQGMSGLMSVTGDPDSALGGGPMKVGPSIADIITGLNAVVAILSALYHRDQNGGEGQHVDLALYDSTVAALSTYAQSYLISGVPPARRGTRGNGGVPSQMFRCSDGAIMLTAGNDRQFQKLCQAIDRLDMVNDPRFVDNPKRILNLTELTAELEAIFVTMPVRHWLESLQAVGVPSGPINTFKEVFDDPQIKARGLKIEVKHPCNSSLPLIGNPIHFSSTPIEIYGPPPLLGEHTEEILDRLGYTKDDCDQLRNKIAI